MGPMAAKTELPLSARRAELADAPLLHAVYTRSPGYFELLGSELPTLVDVESELAAALADPERRLELLFLRDEVVGLLDYKLHHPEDDAATLSLVLITEDHRGLGLGQRAVRNLEAALSPEFRLLYAVVYGQNPSAERFFTRLGYAFQRSGGPAVKWFSKPLRAGP